MWVCPFWLHKNLVALVFFLILLFFFPLQCLFLVRDFYDTGRFCLEQLLLHSCNDKEWHSASDMAFGKCEEKEGRRKSVWVLFSATTERQFQVKVTLGSFWERKHLSFLQSFQGFIYFQILPTDFSIAVYCACSSKLIEVFSCPQ